MARAATVRWAAGLMLRSLRAHLRRRRRPRRRLSDGGAPSPVFAATLDVVDAREERLVENEAMFRRINERIEEIAQAQGAADGHVYEFLCECSNADCTLRVPLSSTAYEFVRRDPTQFVVAPGHDLPEIEAVVFRTQDYQVVRKQGEAAEVAVEEDRRHS